VVPGRTAMPAPTPREEFDLKLVGLEGEVEALAYYVGEAVHRAVDALKNRDLDASRQVIEDDDYIDQKQAEIEARCINLIATQQPVARDLRSIIALLHIGVELERMGDYAEGIGKISLSIGSEDTLKPLIDVPLMAQKATDMLTDSIDALLRRDTEKAQAVRDADDEVDDLYDKVYRDLLEYMINDPETIQRATYLLWVAHDLERIADRATNIAEQVEFLVNGSSLDISMSPSRDTQRERVLVPFR
jgi:phosphate transport system protein